MTAAKKPDKSTEPTTEPGLTPAPEDEPVDATIEPAPANDDRTYLVMRSTDRDGEDGDADEGCLLWAELGYVSAPTKPEAWVEAKKRWPQLVPAAPTAPQDPAKTVRAKLIPKRYSGTIESTMEYVPPRAVTKGI